MSESEQAPNGRLLKYRVDQYGGRLDRIEDWRTRVDEDRVTVKGELKNMHSDLVSLSTAVDAIRRVLVGFAFTIAASAIVFAFSILLATGKL